MARELGVSSQEVIQLLKQTNHFVKSASSTIEAPAARAVRELHAHQAPAPRPSPGQPRKRGPRRPASFTAGPPVPHRVVPAASDDPLDLAALLFDIDRSRLKAAPRPRPPRGETYRPVTRWTELWFSEVEERAWTSRGINSAETAELLVHWGITPRMLETVVDGQTVLGWLQTGEGPGAVVARLRHRGLWLKEA